MNAVESQERFKQWRKMKEIKLTQGKVALVDDGDYKYLSQFKWCAHKHRNNFYAMRQSRINGKRKSILMHREIMNAPNDRQIDHKDHNGLNNCRINLRICTNQENSRNSKCYANNMSGFKGVVWIKRERKWRAKITIKDKKIYLGSFLSLKDAAVAYNNAASKYFGEFALLNEI